ncbi:hypothetical protein [Methylobacterium radiodurans]|uniref:Phasin domain-containing protein n=1 Tax=Methylobacterium radiodurans TaxID=2202828 RepID=A0A2U8VMG6_9HYPH|nr:hypothetical protein [Methylobacterium radiodurans]AWN34611.1 hypothetical protein DK427_01725 [Methylobacterium radiodurans]
MGKQRTPQGQRPGRRTPARRGPAGLGGLATVAEARPTTVAEPVSAPEVPEQDAAPADAFANGGPEAVAPEVSERASDEIAQEEVVEAGPVSSDATETAYDEPAQEPAAGSEPEAVAAAEVPADEASADIVSEEPAAVAASEEVPAAMPVLPDPLLPATTLAAVADEIFGGPRTERPAPPRAVLHFAFAPVRIDVEGISAVVANYLHNESVAAFSYMRALSAARSPADMIRLNVTEMQRAADASLTCWSSIARHAARGVPLH